MVRAQTLALWSAGSARHPPGPDLRPPPGATHRRTRGSRRGPAPGADILQCRGHPCRTARSRGTGASATEVSTRTSAGTWARGDDPRRGGTRPSLKQGPSYSSAHLAPDRGELQRDQVVHDLGPDARVAEERRVRGTRPTALGEQARAVEGGGQRDGTRSTAWRGRPPSPPRAPGRRPAPGSRRASRSAGCACGHGLACTRRRWRRRPGRAVRQGRPQRVRHRGAAACEADEVRRDQATAAWVHSMTMLVAPPTGPSRSRLVTTGLPAAMSASSFAGLGPGVTSGSRGEQVQEVEDGVAVRRRPVVCPSPSSAAGRRGGGNERVQGLLGGALPEPTGGSRGRWGHQARNASTDRSLAR